MENITEGGDVGAINTEQENRKSHIRASEDGKRDEATPNKLMKMTDGAIANQINEEAVLISASANEVSQEADTTAVPANEIDSEVDLGEDDDEYEEDQGVEQKETEGEEEDEQLDLDAEYASDQAPGDFEDDLDEEGEDIYDDEDEMGTTAEETDIPEEEEADSSTELHDFVQSNLAYIEDCQSDIDSLNHKANEEILLVELKYNKLRLPVYKRRNTYIGRVAHFWATVFSQHRQLRQVLTKEDVKCLKYVTKLQVEDFEENRSGYSIQFYFSENPWFDNTVITKEYHLPWHGSPSCSCTPIQWKKGMNLTMKSSSFFSWFTSQSDSSADDIAEIIKDDLWPNPLQCFLLSNKQAGESDEEEDDDEADDSGNLTKDDAVVLLDDSIDDDIEYISSEEEGWEGEKGQTTSTHYLVQGDDDEEQEEEEYEDFDDDEVNVTGTSAVQQQKTQDGGPKGEVISIDDDYLGSEDENDEYLEGTVDLEGDERLLRGQAEDFEEPDNSNGEGNSPKISDRLGETEIQNVDSNHDDSRHSNGVVGSSTNEGGDYEKNITETSSDSTSKVQTKMQEQSKVVSTSTAGDSDVATGAT